MTTLAPSFDRIFFILAGNEKFGQIGPRTAELAALERLEKSHRLIMGEIL